MYRIRVFFLCIIVLILCLSTSCHRLDRNVDTITVSIDPLRFITEQITGNDFNIQVLVPPGSSPETYEPTSAQMLQTARSKAYIEIGLLDFEINLEQAIRENMPQVTLIKSSDRVPLLAEHCGHTHNDEEHTHGVDPHIWLSPTRLKTIAENVYNGLSVIYPDSSKYKENYDALCKRIDSLDRSLVTLLTPEKRGFLIYHPALTYLAADYGQTQISVEVEGKEPSAAYLSRLIDTVKAMEINKILYQKQFDQSTVAAVATELDLTLVAIDPLAENVIENIEYLARLIANRCTP
ncbi:MAG TPA: zinc ABC transporter substrate-binding protein [Candidatus Alistipes merdigallinarum]|nr:zinc ABC transporter substrate-binding protein [Candidatus Alistipes merdigallinarum]